MSHSATIMDSGAIMIALRGTPRALLTFALIFAALACIGLLALAMLWGKLEYGLSGYLVVWGPFVAAMLSAALFMAYFRAK